MISFSELDGDKIFQSDTIRQGKKTLWDKQSQNFEESSCRTVAPQEIHVDGLWS